MQADLEALPFRPDSLGGAWASKSYQHIARDRLRHALAELGTSLGDGAPLTMTVFPGEVEARSADGFPGRLLTLWGPGPLAETVHEGGFDVDSVRIDRRGRLTLSAHRIPGTGPTP